MVRVSKVQGVRTQPTATQRRDADRVQVVQVNRPRRAVRWHVSRATTRVSK
jgi:hypothetical protein